MRESKLKRDDTAMDHLGYALYAFGGLGLEILLMMIETNLWGLQNKEWSISQNIIHWGITCAIWGIFTVVLVKKSLRVHSKVKEIQWHIAGVIVIGSILYTSYVWGGFKPAIEFHTNGALKFIVQYLYYAFESMLILLIVAHGQKAFEKFTNNHRNLPVGGLLLALTWGVIHIATQGVETGIYACMQSLLFGTVYVVLKKDITFSYIAIALMFML